MSHVMPLYDERVPLGLTHVADCRVMPFVSLDCDRMRMVLQSNLELTAPDLQMDVESLRLIEVASLHKSASQSGVIGFQVLTRATPMESVDPSFNPAHHQFQPFIETRCQTGQGCVITGFRIVGENQWPAYPS